MISPHFTKDKRMPRIVKCTSCKKDLCTKEEKFKLSGKTYCEDCYKVKKLEADEYKALMDYIYETFYFGKKYGEDAPAILFPQIKNLHNEKKYNYSAISYTLWYVIEILEFKFDIRKYGVQYVVETYYLDAEKYFIQQEEKRKKLEKISLQSNVNKVKRTASRNNSKMLIDLNNIS